MIIDMIKIMAAYLKLLCVYGIPIISLEFLIYFILIELI